MPDLLTELTDEGVLLLTLNRPETLNSLGGTLTHDLIQSLRDSRGDPSVRCIVITGAGRGFCSGATVQSSGPRAVADRPKLATIDEKLGESGEVVMAMAQAEAPIVGAINGPAAGAGFGLALCCDVRIASDQARMGSIFIKRGLATDFGTGYWLPRIVGPVKAYEMLYAGDLMDAPALLAAGVVNRVVPHYSLMDETMAYARTLADGPSAALKYTRRNVIRAIEADLRAYLVEEWAHQTELLSSDDAREGFRAFSEKRRPNFRR